MNTSTNSSMVSSDSDYRQLFVATGWISVVGACICCTLCFCFFRYKLKWANQISRHMFYAMLFLSLSSSLLVVHMLGAFVKLNYCQLPDMLTWLFPEVCNPLSVCMNVVIGVARVKSITNSGTLLPATEWRNLLILDTVTKVSSVCASMMFVMSGVPAGISSACVWIDWWIMLRVCTILYLDILNTVGAYMLISTLSHIMQSSHPESLKMIKHNAIVSCLIYKPHIAFEFYRFFESTERNLYIQIFLQISALACERAITCLCTYRMVKTTHLDVDRSDRLRLETGTSQEQRQLHSTSARFAARDRLPLQPGTSSEQRKVHNSGARSAAARFQMVAQSSCDSLPFAVKSTGDKHSTELDNRYD